MEDSTSASAHFEISWKTLKLLTLLKREYRPKKEYQLKHLEFR